MTVTSTLLFSLLLALAPEPPQEVDGAGEAVADEPTRPAEEGAADAAATEFAMAALPGFADLSDDVKARLAAMDEVAIDSLMGRFDKDETLSEEDQAVAEGILHMGQAEFESKVTYRSGDIELGEGLATLRLGDAFRYLNPQDSARILEDAWGNPPGAETLGMLFPADVSPLSAEGWGVIVSYSEDGHVEDDDADDIDYDDLLADMKEGTAEDNKSRKEQGYPGLELVGWAEPPHYDGVRHTLYWAKELAGEGAPEHSLNYAIRVLGREGVLELNAVAGMSQIGDIKPQMETVYSVVDFSTGHRYIDFDPDIDSVAAYGIGGLIAGKVAMKVGLFAGLFKYLLVAKKFIFIGVLAAFAGIKAFFGRGKSAEDEAMADPGVGDPPVDPPADS